MNILERQYYIIKRYIVLTTQGFTENNDMMSTNNMQVLGWAEGINPPDAVRRFKKNMLNY